MTEKRFTIVNMGLDGQYIKENGKIMTIERVVDLLNENEQLKSIIDKLTLDNTKMKKVLNTTKKENEQIKHIIKEAYETERTDLGKSVLKQLIEGLE